MNQMEIKALLAAGILIAFSVFAFCYIFILLRKLNCKHPPDKLTSHQYKTFNATNECVGEMVFIKCKQCGKVIDADFINK